MACATDTVQTQELATIQETPEPEQLPDTIPADEILQDEQPLSPRTIIKQVIEEDLDGQAEDLDAPALKALFTKWKNLAKGLSQHLQALVELSDKDYQLYYLITNEGISDNHAIRLFFTQEGTEIEEGEIQAAILALRGVTKVQQLLMERDGDEEWDGESGTSDDERGHMHWSEESSGDSDW